MAPPNDRTFWILGCSLVLLAVLRLAVDRRRFPGPPPGSLLHSHREERVSIPQQRTVLLSSWNFIIVNFVANLSFLVLFRQFSWGIDFRRMVLNLNTLGNTFWRRGRGQV